jgi:hypothetical protein
LPSKCFYACLTWDHESAFKFKSLDSRDSRPPVIRKDTCVGLRGQSKPTTQPLPNGESSTGQKTPEQVAHTDDLKEMLRAALLRAEEARRGLLEAFTLGHHERLGAASRILPLAPEVVQMIMDRV